MGHDLPKQFLCIGTRPVLMHAIERFISYNKAVEVVLVLPPDQFTYWQALCRKYNFTVAHRLISGGDSRYQSVKNGLEGVEGEGLVAIHDGVRPFVSLETIERCFYAAEKHGCAIPVVEVVDSLRKIEGPRSKMRLRASYRVVQTPQVFKNSIIRQAYKLPFSPDFTDDASVAEAAGYDITLVEGNRENIKITTPFDLVMGEALLKSRLFRACDT
jgi:2-C-methyl-D-erythritol 4-phosphate cytidylyltransferase